MIQHKSDLFIRCAIDSMCISSSSFEAPGAALTHRMSNDPDFAKVVSSLKSDDLRDIRIDDALHLMKMNCSRGF